MIICKILKCINIKILIIEFLLILSYLLIDIAIFCLPLYYGKILEDFISGINSFNKLLIWAAITLTLVLLEIFMSFMSDRIENNIETILQKKLINDTFANANLEIDHRGSGYYGNILIDTLSKIASLFRIEVLKPLLKIIVLIVIMFIISLVNITVGLITILFIIMYFITFHLGNTYYCKSSERLSKESLENKSYVNDTLKGVNLIRNFHAKNHEVNRLKNKNVVISKKYISFRIKDFFLSFALLDILQAVYSIAIFVLCILFAFDDVISIPTAIVLISYTGILITPVKEITNNMYVLKNGYVASKIYMNSLFENEGKKCILSSIENITYNNITVVFENRIILKKFTTSFQRGNHYCITGESGSGKSTLVKILLNFINPEDGEMTINDIAVQNINLESLFNNIAFLLQDSSLFEGSLYNNILLNNTIDEITLKEMFITFNLEEIYQEYRNNKIMLPTQLSLGERNRLLLIRTILNSFQKEWVVLDEPLVGVDTNTKSKIIEYLKDVFKNKTLVLITHDELLIQTFSSNLININAYN